MQYIDEYKLHGNLSPADPRMQALRAHVASGETRTTAHLPPLPVAVLGQGPGTQGENSCEEGGGKKGQSAQKIEASAATLARSLFGLQVLRVAEQIARRCDRKQVPGAEIARLCPVGFKSLIHKAGIHFLTIRRCIACV
jgi:hypothetical protein